MTIEVIFGADYVTTSVVMELLPAADTCSMEAATLLPLTIDVVSAADSCSLAVENGLLVSLDLQQASDTGSVTSAPNPIPVPVPITVFPTTNPFAVDVTPLNYNVIIPAEESAVTAEE